MNEGDLTWLDKRQYQRTDRNEGL